MISKIKFNLSDYFHQNNNNNNNKIYYPHKFHKFIYIKHKSLNFQIKRFEKNHLEFFKLLELMIQMR
jgi:hypothetical protein